KNLLVQVIEDDEDEQSPDRTTGGADTAARGDEAGRGGATSGRDSPLAKDTTSRPGRKGSRRFEREEDRATVERAKRAPAALFDRSGGFTAQAYVYGLEFSREETRQRQRENLSAAVTRLQALSATQSARDAANRRDDSGDRSAAVSNAATQAQLARLAQLQPN